MCVRACEAYKKGKREKTVERAREKHNSSSNNNNGLVQTVTVYVVNGMAFDFVHTTHTAMPMIETVYGTHTTRNITTKTEQQQKSKNEAKA